MGRRSRTLLAVTLVAAPTAAAGAETFGPDAFGYSAIDNVGEPEGPVFAFFDISGTGTLVASGDNVSSGAIILRRPFTLYGDTYQLLFAATNGFISSAGNAGPDLGPGCPLPVPPLVGGGARIAGLHGHLVGDVYYEDFDVSPVPHLSGVDMPAMIFQWNVSHAIGEPGPVVFQAVLYANRDLLFQFVSNPETGAGTTTGIQNDTHDLGLTIHCFSTGSITGGYAVHIAAPTGPPLPGACCLPDATCAEVMGDDCAALDGVYHGNFSVCASTLCPVGVIWDNGPFVTSPGGGCNEADASELQTALGGDIVGYGVQANLGVRLADDFTIAAPCALQAITFYAYQSGPATSSTLTTTNLQIWDGPPNEPASAVVYGDAVTNRQRTSVWSGAYRATDAFPGICSRAIMANVVEIGAELDPGTYWLDWQSDGRLDLGPFAPPVTFAGAGGSGNALQFLAADDAWFPAFDQGGFWPDDLPFLIHGDCPAACPEDLTGPEPGGGPDGVVDRLDLIFLLARFGGAGPEGDLTGPDPGSPPDGVVDVFDLLALLAVFGESCG